jgi:Spy/CpxP family protein refolding chaperone
MMLTLHPTLHSLRAAAAFAACLLAAPAVLAQSMPPEPGPGDGGPGWHQHEERGAPRFLRGLDLSEAQHDRVFAILHAQAPKRREFEKAERQAGQALRELSRAPELDAARAAASTQALGQAIAGRELLRLQTGAQLMAVLSPQQRERLEQAKEGRRDGHREGRREGRQDERSRQRGDDK